ncbi:envelope stress response membrane protein PspC [Shewanella sp. NIFS-20-20]|uniref:envelope stress response membrane protein PspC n=1 Tax=Shewanella sp. NIFS-20-20 TaxID=2853806 RepID=UPI001C44B7B5|nr:envelope stress response membrane protein PspC [Shewanella sp. NIFS-20-20]MBV7315944.1 envelope stress response membrane protein PspC [Shewanella sp. NIFS-20-20]
MSRGTLYRNRAQGKIAGVCAGIADYFNFETWLVRVVAVSIFLLGGSGVIFILYIALWIILDESPKPLSMDAHHKEAGLKKKVWQAGEPAKQALMDLNGRFRAIDLRLQQMERHVTSEQFDLKRQINDL